MTPARTARTRIDAGEGSACAIRPPYPETELRRVALASSGVRTTFAFTAAPPLAPPASPSPGPCLQHTIHGGDCSENGEWWDKFDAVDTNAHSDCEPG